jgi:hypothetical protein
MGELARGVGVESSIAGVAVEAVRVRDGKAGVEGGWWARVKKLGVVKSAGRMGGK